MGGPVQDVLLRTAMGPQQARALVQEVANALGFTVRSPQGRLDPAHLCEVEAPWDRSGSDVLLLPAEQEREPGELDALTRACGFGLRGRFR